MTIKMTEELLAEFNACGDYIRKFKRHFPASDERYEDGVDVTGEIVRAHLHDYDWQWASTRMFNDEAQQRFTNAQYGYDDESKAIASEQQTVNDTFRHGQREWREKYGEDDWSVGSTPEARAAYNELRDTFQKDLRAVEQRLQDRWTNLFAELFNDERCHSRSMKQALVNAEDRRVRYDEDRLQRITETVTSLRVEIRYWTEEPETQCAHSIAKLEERRAELAREIDEQRVYWVEEPPKKIDELTGKLTAAEQKLADLRTRVMERRTRRLESAVQRANAAVETAQREAAERLEQLEAARRQATEQLEAAQRVETVETVETVAS